MSLRWDLRQGRRIGRAEFVRTLRRYRRDRRRLLGLAVPTLFFGGYLLTALPGVYLLGRNARSLAAVPYIEPAATLVPAGLVVLAALRTAERLAGIDAEALLLTTVHPRALVFGLVIAELGRLALWFGLPLAAVVVAFALGLGAPTLPVTAALVAVPMVCCTALWGYAGGVLLVRVLRRLPAVRRLLKVVGVLGMVAVVVLSQVVARSLVDGDLAVGALLSAVSLGPMTDYLALAVLGTPLARPVGAGALAALAGWVGLAPVGLAIAHRQAAALWATDDAGGRAARPQAGGGGFDAPRPFAWTTGGRIGWGLLLRAVRQPQDLAHLLVVVFMLGPLGGTLLENPGGSGFGLLVAGAGVVLGTYLAGGAFGLNPFGDDRPQMSLLLLTPVEPRTHLRGRMVAGLAVGLPFVALGTTAGLLLGAGPGALGFGAAGVGFTVAAAAFALGLGCAYPIYEQREVWGTETVSPSTLVLMTYSIVVTVGSAIGLLVVVLALGGGLPTTGLVAGAVGLYLLVTAGLPALSYRYALRRYRRYTLD